MAQPSHHLLPTFVGFMESAYDAAVLFEACIRGHLPRISCRPSTSYREGVAKSGQVFVFEEKESGIQRWTDGLRWSPSRILEGFLVYRQLDEGRTYSGNPRQAIRRVKRKSDSPIEDRSRLYGSLIDSYHFQEGGLIKKTISVKLGEGCWRLVSYYSVEDVECGRLLRPAQWSHLPANLPREELQRMLHCEDVPGEPSILPHHNINHVEEGYWFAHGVGYLQDRATNAQYSENDVSYVEACTGPEQRG